MRPVLALAVALAAAACSREPARLGLGAAAVMRHAMPELVARYRERAGVAVDVIYGASDTIAARAADGVGLDALVVADGDAYGGMNVTDPLRIASTELVLVGPRGSALRFDQLADSVIAIGDPRTVPAGRYARHHLERIGVWPQVAARAVLGGDVAAVLALAQRGSAHAAIVYATDAVDAAPLVALDRADTRVDILAAALPGRPRQQAAAAFVRFLTSPTAREILARHGFGP